MELIYLNEAVKKYGLNKNQLRAYAKRKSIIKIGEMFCENSIKEFISKLKVIDFKNEIWLQNDILDSRYYFSNLGRVKTIKYKNGNTERLIKPALTDGYYKSVFLTKKGESKSFRIHRLVCMCFHKNSDFEILEVNHIDGNKINNNSSNLEWCTRAKNIKHCIDNKLQKPFKGEEIGNSILKEFQVLEIRKKFKPRVYTRKMLSLEYKVSEATIKEVVNRYTWKHI